MSDTQPNSESQSNHPAELIFIGYTLAILVDLTVINLFDSIGFTSKIKVK